MADGNTVSHRPYEGLQNKFMKVDGILWHFPSMREKNWSVYLLFVIWELFSI